MKFIGNYVLVCFWKWRRWKVNSNLSCITATPVKLAAFHGVVLTKRSNSRFFLWLVFEFAWESGQIAISFRVMREFLPKLVRSSRFTQGTSYKEGYYFWGVQLTIGLSVRWAQKRVEVVLVKWVLKKLCHNRESNHLTGVWLRASVTVELPVRPSAVSKHSLILWICTKQYLQRRLR